MLQTTFAKLSRLLVNKRNLLRFRIKNTAYNPHATHLKEPTLS